ncbi:MAG: hypothetical protein AB1806_03990 [Acidobacteriota bacterium]
MSPKGSSRRLETKPPYAWLFFLVTAAAALHYVAEHVAAIIRIFSGPD